MAKLQPGFGVYFDPTKTTSGQRFFRQLCKAMSARTVPFRAKPGAVLFNISGRIHEIAFAKLRGQKIALRVDGLYHDRLSREFLATFPAPLRSLLGLGLRFTWLHDPMAHLANFIDQNWKAFVRILLADIVIYQSLFSRDLHSRYFRAKPHRVIVNGSIYGGGRAVPVVPEDGEIRLVTIYNDWKPAKRLSELVEFICWAREVRGIAVSLAILGYTGKMPRGAHAAMKEAMETRTYFKTLPKFSEYSGEAKEILLNSDLYITFTNRDPCPNVVVEAMAHGLPVVGLRSGGLPDIVGEAGILLPDGDAAGFFSPSRHEPGFAPIDFETVLSAILDVKRSSGEYRAKVRKRFEEDLAIEIVAERYVAALESII